MKKNVRWGGTQRRILLRQKGFSIQVGAISIMENEKRMGCIGREQVGRGVKET